MTNSTSNNILTGDGARTVVQRMGEAANHFLDSLTQPQRDKALLDFADQEKRITWHYTPTQRDGLPLTEMEFPQQRLAQMLVATGLSRAGYVTASTIMGLETTLDNIEGWTRPLPGRDSRLYYMSIFGRPSDSEPWGWRYEGHHISLNYTIAKGQIVAPTPTFFGANPAEALLGNVGALRPLSGVEDLARDFIHALNTEQQVQAILTPTAPADIIMANRPWIVDDALPISTLNWSDESTPLAQRAERAQQEAEQKVAHHHHEAVRYSAKHPKGLGASAMKATQREIMIALITEYINRMPDELAEIEMAKLEEREVDGIHFAWAGGLERNQPHYYRLQGTRFLVEYDNTQNDANHIHSVWRDPEDDFGAQLLAQHYAHDH